MVTKKPNRAEEAIGKIFKDADAAFGLKEFEGIDAYKVLEITEDEPGRYYVKDLKSGKSRFVYDEKKGTGKPEEIVRQLWLYKLNAHYKYPWDRMDTEKAIHFGREIHSKAVDIVVYKSDKITPYILVEVKAPSESKGIDQLKSYLNADGSEIGVWSNGNKRVILYRPYPKEFDDTLPDLPPAGTTIDDLLEAKKTYFDYTSTKRNLTATTTRCSSASTAIRRRPIPSSTTSSKNPSKSGPVRSTSRKISTYRQSTSLSWSASLSARGFSVQTSQSLTKHSSISSPKSPRARKGSISRRATLSQWP